ncbi:MAG: hypothetical protein IKX25_01925 [Bacteroidales bacterium]|nr:hypothetical protein [Bacteroidales bacterium]
MLIISTINKDESLAAREGAAGELVFIEIDDNTAVRRLKEVADRYDDSNGKRLECYLLLKNQTSLWLLQSVGLPKEIENKVDVFATTIEDLLAKTVFIKLPNIQTPFPSLDRTAISRDSDSTVHLVIVGFSSQTEALAINAALVAHYPNYCRDTRLRTRITLIDDNVFEGRDHLIQRYVHLFENSYYRTINLHEDNPHCILHRPMYENFRKDFVDVEWEFVNGNIRNEAIRQKLKEWSTDSRQQLTIAICHSDYNRNFNEAFGLPETIYKNEIPVLCCTEDSDILHVATNGGAYSSIYPFGKDHCDVNTLRMLKKLAQRVNYVYNHCFSLSPDDPITAPSSIDVDLLESQWKSVGSLTKQYSNIFNAMTLGTKLHSLGHTSDDWKEYYALTMEEINILSEVEHNRWSVEELILGYRPVTAEEQDIVDKDISQKKILRNTKKAHYDLRAYDDLRADSTGKNVNVYDMALTQGIPLIIKTCITD